MELDNNLPWIEKYRPKSVDEISSQEEVVQVLKKSLHSKNLPHLLFYGPPGTGKTSSILALSRELYGPELYKSRVLELNASDERGITVIRERIKNFAKITVGTSNPNAMNDPSMDYPCPPFKIIILDEADSLTKDAQAALRRTMETYSKTTRFCIICNYITRIIEPLASRCAKFRFKSIPQSLYVNRIKYISDLEGLPIEDQAISRLGDLTDGDLRKGIMYLQSAHRFAEINGKVTASDIEQLVGVVPTPTVEACVKLLLSKNIYQVTEWLNEFMLDGFPGYQLLIQVHDVLINHPELTSIQKSNISVLMGKVDRYLTEGAGDHLQLLQLLVGIVTILNTK